MKKKHNLNIDIIFNKYGFEGLGKLHFLQAKIKELKYLDLKIYALDDLINLLKFENIKDLIIFLNLLIKYNFITLLNNKIYLPISLIRANSSKSKLTYDDDNDNKGVTKLTYNDDNDNKGVTKLIYDDDNDNKGVTKLTYDDNNDNKGVTKLTFNDDSIYTNTNTNNILIQDDNFILNKLEKQIPKQEEIFKLMKLITHNNNIFMALDDELLLFESIKFVNYNVKNNSTSYNWESAVNGWLLKSLKYLNKSKKYINKTKIRNNNNI